MQRHSKLEDAYTRIRILEKDKFIHTVSIVKENSTGDVYYCKEESQLKIALRERSAQEFIRALYPSNVETKLAIDVDGKMYVLSRAKEKFISLRALILRDGEDVVIEKINNGTYKGFGKILVLGLLTTENDLHTDNIGLDEVTNEFVKIDGDWTFGRLRYKEGNFENLGAKFAITPGVLNCLPLLEVNAFKPYNWFDQIRRGMLYTSSFLPKLDQSVIRQEINEEILRILLFPIQYLSKIINHQTADAKLAHGMMLELMSSRLQLLYSACNNQSFIDYIKKEETSKLLLKISEELNQFRMVGNTELDRNAFALIMINERFNQLSEILIQPVNSPKWVEKFKKMIDFDVNTQNHLNESPIFICAKNNDGFLGEIMAQNVNAVSSNGYTPILMAAKAGNTSLFDRLAKNGANFSAVANDGYSALTLAAHCGNIAIVEFMVDFVTDINSQTGLGETALLHAVRAGHLDIVSHLISRGANVNLADPYGVSPLYYAAKLGRLDIFNVLIEGGADKNAATCDKKTPFSVACDNEHNDIVTYLLLLEVAPNFLNSFFQQQDTNNLGEFIQNQPVLKKMELCASLKSYRPKTNDDLIATEVMYYNLLPIKWHSIMLALNHIEINFIQKIISQNATNQPDARGVTPLSITLVKELMKQGVDINTRSTDGTTLLCTAASEGYLDIAKVLIENRADVNAANNAGQTPLIFAAQDGRVEIVKALVNSGANLNHKDIQGNTAMDIACKRGKGEVVTQLLKSGAELGNAKIDHMMLYIFDLSLSVNNITETLNQLHKQLNNDYRISRFIANNLVTFLSDTVNEIDLTSTINSNDALSILEKARNHPIFAATTSSQSSLMFHPVSHGKDIIEKECENYRVKLGKTI